MYLFIIIQTTVTMNKVKTIDKVNKGSIRAIFGLIFKMTHFVSVYSIELVICKNANFLFILWSVTMATRTLSRIPFLTENTPI